MNNNNTVPENTLIVGSSTIEIAGKFTSPAEARAFAAALLEGVMRFEEAMYAEAGRQVMDVEFANSRDGSRVYLVTQTDTTSGYSSVCQMHYPNPPHREAAILEKGQSWTSDEFRYTLHGLFDRVAVIDERTTRYVEVPA